MTEYTNIIFGEEDTDLVSNQPQEKQAKENFSIWIFKFFKNISKHIYPC